MFINSKLFHINIKIVPIYQFVSNMYDKLELSWYVYRQTKKEAWEIKKLKWINSIYLRPW